MNMIGRWPVTGRAWLEPTCQERHWCRQMLERGLSHRGLPLKRKFRPRCCAKTRAGVPCITRVVPGKRRCRFHGGMPTGPKTKAGRARIAEVQRRATAVEGLSRCCEAFSDSEEDPITLHSTLGEFDRVQWPSPHVRWEWSGQSEWSRRGA